MDDEKCKWCGKEIYHDKDLGWIIYCFGDNHCVVTGQLHEPVAAAGGPCDWPFEGCCDQKEACLKANRCLKNLPEPSAHKVEPSSLDDSRCAVCGWPLAETVEKGCTRGNCSMRPLPNNIYDPARANREYGKEYFKVAPEPVAGTQVESEVMPTDTENGHDTRTSSASATGAVSRVAGTASAPQAVLQKLVDWDKCYPRNNFRIVEYGAVQASEKELDTICEEAHKVLAAPSVAGTPAVARPCCPKCGDGDLALQIISLDNLVCGKCKFHFTIKQPIDFAQFFPAEPLLKDRIAELLKIASGDEGGPSEDAVLDYVKALLNAAARPLRTPPAPDLRELQELMSEVIIAPDDPGVECFDDGSGLDGVILRGSPSLRQIVLHILNDWEVVSDNYQKLQERLKPVPPESAAREIAREWYEAMKADDPHHFAEHEEDGGHDFPDTICEYTFEMFSNCPMVKHGLAILERHLHSAAQLIVSSNQVLGCECGDKFSLSPYRHCGNCGRVAGTGQTGGSQVQSMAAQPEPGR